MIQADEIRDSYRGARVAVLGASGFLGRWVAWQLSQLGSSVLLIVRDKQAGHRIPLAHGTDSTILEVDLAGPPSVIEDLYQDTRPSITFNLAGYGVDRSERDEQMFHQINAELVQSVCKAIDRVRDPAWHGQDIIHAGSMAEYGPIGGDLSEDSTPNPTSIYGRSKLLGTEFLARYCHSTDVSGLTARLFTVYGPGEHTDRLLPSLFRTARTGTPLKLTTGKQRRDFTYAADVAEGLLRLGVATKAQGEPVNLATGTLTSVERFVRVAAHLLQIPSGHLEFGAIPVHTEEIEHQPVTLAGLDELAHWVPPTGIAAGICKTLQPEHPAFSDKRS